MNVFQLGIGEDAAENCIQTIHIAGHFDACVPAADAQIYLADEIFVGIFFGDDGNGGIHLVKNTDLQIAAALIYGFAGADALKGHFEGGIIPFPPVGFV